MLLLRRVSVSEGRDGHISEFQADNVNQFFPHFVLPLGGLYQSEQSESWLQEKYDPEGLKNYKQNWSCMIKN